MINQGCKLHLSVKIAFLGILLFNLLACQDTYEVNEPDELISKQKMIDIIEDMMLMDAAKNISSRQFRVNDIRLYDVIKTKYDIDSTRLRQNLEYYNQQFEVNIEIYDSVKARLQRRKNSVDSIAIVKDSIKMFNIDRNKKRQDSIKKAKVSVKN